MNSERSLVLRSGGETVLRRVLLIWSGLILCWCMSAPVFATDKCGPVCDETWDVAGEPFVVTCDVSVAAGCQLTIDAGVDVQFQTGTRLTVEGQLDVNGTSGSPVTFTSDAASPAANDWYGITVQSSGAATLDHATVSYAYRGIQALGTSSLALTDVTSSWHSSHGVYITNNASGTLTRLTTTDNGEHGVFVLELASATLTEVTSERNANGLVAFVGNGASVSATSSRFTGNAVYGVYVSRYGGTNPVVTVTGSSIHSNLGTYDYYVYPNFVEPATTVLNATNNWWGTTDATAIRYRIHEHANDGGSARVDWCGYLDSAGGVPVDDVYCPDPIICNEPAVWDQTDKPYLLVTDVDVCPTGVLQVGAGVEVRAVPGLSLDITVEGQLEVGGTSGSPVTFTSDAASPAANDWYGITVQSSGAATLDHATVSYAYRGIQALGTSSLALTDVTSSWHSSHGVYITNNASGTLTRLTTTDNGEHGVFVLELASATLTEVTSERNANGLVAFVGNGASVSATSSRFTGNAVYGVYVSRYGGTNPVVTVTGSSIHSNLGTYDYYVYPNFVEPATTVLNATNNWWGTTDATAIRYRIHEHANDGGSARVDWCGYLDSAGGVPVDDVYCPDPIICNEPAVWDQTDKPYLLVTDVDVCPTGVLQVGAGVEVRAVPGLSLDITVEGQLEVGGTSGSPVTFTSDAASPAANDWYGITVQSSGAATLDHATVSYAYRGIQALGTSSLALTDVTSSWHSSHGVYITNNASGTLTRLTTTDNGEHGVFVLELASATLTEVTSERNANGLVAFVGNGASVSATSSRFTGNAVYGVYVSRYGGTNPVVTVTGSSIHSNLGTYDYYVYPNFVEPATTVLNATNNWWGTTDATAIRYRIHEHANDGGSARVDWCGYLDSAGGVPVDDVYCPDPIICNEPAVWDQTDKPYLLVTDVDVCPTGVLQVGAGVEVRAVPGLSLDITVEGQLEVGGTSGSPVTFTSDAASPAANDWYGITVQSSGAATLDHATVSYAYRGIQALGTSSLALTDVTSSWHSSHGVYITNNASGTLTRLTTTDNGEHGVFVLELASATLTEVTSERNANGLVAFVGNGASVSATSSRFTGNAVYGVYVSRYGGTNPVVTVTGSSIHSNLGTYDYYVYPNFVEPATTVLNATNNWWGTTDATAIRYRIHEHANDGGSARVDWCGYLDSAGGVPVDDVYCPDPIICNEPAVWDQTDKPYLLVTDVDVCPTGVLQVGAGVEVRAVPGLSLDITVEGQLEVGGTSGSPVTFTSDAASPAANDWYGITVQSSGAATLDHATVSYAYRGIQALGTSSLALTDVTSSWHSSHGVYITNNASGTLTRLTTTDNGEHGVFVLELASATLTEVTSERNANGLVAFVGNGASVSATSSRFTGNAVYGVYVSRYGGTNPVVTVTGSSIHSNLGTYDYYVYPNFVEPATTVLNATNNWWGTTDATAIRYRIHEHANDGGSARVDWCGYLDSAGGVPVDDVYCPDPIICNEPAVWDQTDKPYLLVTDVDVCPTGVLQVGAGVEVRAVPGLSLDITVEGQLEVGGTSGSPVTFTSDAASPAANDWYGITVQSSGAATLDHATVSYAYRGIQALGTSSLALTDVTSSWHSSHGVYITNNASGTLTRLTTTDNGEHGVFVLELASATLTEVTSERNANGLVAFVGNGASVSATSSRFTGNAVYGVYVSRYGGTNPVVTVTGSSIHSNLGTYDYYVYPNTLGAATTLFWTPDCWWGTDDLDTIRARIHDYDDNGGSGRVLFDPFDEMCVIAIGRDDDRDRVGDFDDNCPALSHHSQVDTDGDGMGDPCDPDPGTAPAAPCDGIDDATDGYLDGDGDGWGDPCDFQPTRADCYPGAPEICDGRDNDGDAIFAIGELIDEDMDRAIACGDCDEMDPNVYPCACEECANLVDDDCDGEQDGNDPECQENPYCVVVTAGAGEPVVHVEKGNCGGASVSGPFDVIRGDVEHVTIVGGSVDLGPVECVASLLAWDRVTDLSADPNPECNRSITMYLARETGDLDFGSSNTGEPRDTMAPNPPCP